MSFFWLLPRDPWPPTACPAVFSAQWSCNSGTVLRPCSSQPGRPRDTAAGAGGVWAESCGTRTSGPPPRPFAHSCWAALIYFPPAIKKAKPRPSLQFCSCLGLTDCLLPGHVQRERLLQADTRHTAVASPHGTGGFD